MPAITKAYIAEIKQILKEARAKTFSAVNFAMIEAYWLIGKRITEEDNAHTVCIIELVTYSLRTRQMSLKTVIEKPNHK